MLRPAIGEDLKKDQSIFSLVIAVSKRAREITDEIEEQKKELMDRNNGKLPTDLGGSKIFLESKPVKLAVEEFAAHKTSYRMLAVEDDDED